MKTIAKAFICYIFLINSTYSQFEYRVDRLPLNEGISHNVIYSITQDPDDFLWLGTMFGLTRYDGKEFLNFRSDPEDINTLSDDDIVTIHSSDKGEVWVGTFGGGFNSLNLFSNKVKRYTPENTGIMEWSGIVWDIEKDNNNNIWIATNNQGILKLNTITDSVEKLSNTDSIKILPSNFVRGIVIDDDKIWFSGYGGLSVFDLQNNESKIYPFKEVENFFIKCLVPLNDDEFLCGTTQGIVSFNKVTGKYSRGKSSNSDLKYASINSMLLSSAGYLWVGTENGLFVCDKELNVITVIREGKRELYSDSIVSLHEDHSGNIWVGSYLGGVSKITVGKQKFQFVEVEPSSNQSVMSNEIKDIVINDEKIWTLSDKTISRLNSQFKTEKIYKKFGGVIMGNSTKTFTTLVKSTNEKFYVGTSNGLYETDDEFRIIKEFSRENDSLSSNYINKLLVDSKDNLWIGTTWGLSRLDYKTKKISSWIPNSKKGITGNNILSIYEDNYGKIWVGTYRGLNLIHTETNKIQYISPGFNDKTKLSNKYVFDFYEPDSLQLWIATGNGINIYDRQKKFFQYLTTNDGLENGVIKSIVGNRDNMFIGTNKGISSYQTKIGLFKNYDLEDGVGNPMFTAGCKQVFNDSLVLFGGLNGLTIINTKNLSENANLTNTQITELNIFGKKINQSEWKEKIEFDYNQNSITIKFAALEFTNSSKNKFSYMLSGVDKEWVYTSSNTVTYHSLPHAQYKFSVKSANNDGVWNEKYATIDFNILPPFWKTEWFYFIVALFILSLALLFHYKRIQNKIKVFLKIEEAKQIENEVVRKRAAEDFHDELGHHLTKISLLIELLKSKYLEKDGEEHISRLGVLSKELSTKMRDFVWSLDSKNNSLYDLIIRLKDFGDELFFDTTASFTVNGISEELKTLNLSLDWRRHLTLIFKEAMNNIVKYSNCSKVELNINVKNNSIMIELNDDGNGFDFSKIKYGNGLNNMKSRAEYLKAKLAIISKINSGTQIKLEGLIT